MKIIFNQYQKLLGAVTATVLIIGLALGIGLSAKALSMPPAGLSSVIGFIGDSITYGSRSSDPATKNGVANMINDLGSGYSAVNRGVSGATTYTWLNAVAGRVGSPYLPDAKTAFSDAGVEIVVITLGTNDARTTSPEAGPNEIPAADYKANLQNIITQLKAIGVKKIILNYPPSVRNNQTSIDLNSQYQVVLKELVDGNAVFLGDTEASSCFADVANAATTGCELDDGLHPNDTGYVALGQFWADAFARVMLDPPTLTHDFVDTDTHQTGSNVNLTYSTDKPAEWFNGYFAGVLVDGKLIDPANYTVSGSNSTNITLTSAYLNTLATGSHSLAVRWTDGVSVSGDSFMITAVKEATNGGVETPTNPAPRATPGVPNTGGNTVKQFTAISLTASVITSGLLAIALILKRIVQAKRRVAFGNSK